MKFSIILSSVCMYLLANPVFASQASSAVCEQLFRADNGAAKGAVLPTGNQTCVETEPLHPFTHQAQIPASANLASIRFQGIKLVRVATELKLTEDPDYCKQQIVRDPGGSAFCPQEELGAFEPAYQITYSYTAPALASDEHGGANYSFSAYFRPDELDAKVIQDVAVGKIAGAAEWFELATSRHLQRRLAIDENASTLCAGVYVDGIWTQQDDECQENVVFKTVTEPSDNVTVQIKELTSTRAGGESFK